MSISDFSAFRIKRSDAPVSSNNLCLLVSTYIDKPCSDKYSGDIVLLSVIMVTVNVCFLLDYQLYSKNNLISTISFIADMKYVCMHPFTQTLINLYITKIYHFF